MLELEVAVDIRYTIHYKLVVNCVVVGWVVTVFTGHIDRSIRRRYIFCIYVLFPWSLAFSVFLCLRFLRGRVYFC